MQSSIKGTNLNSNYSTFSDLRAKCKHQSKLDYYAYIKITELSCSSFLTYFRKYIRNLQQKPLILSSVHLNDITSTIYTVSV